MKIDVKKLWKTKRKMVLGLTAGITAAAIGCGFWYRAGHSSSAPVYVFPFQYVGMTEYWGDVQESNGPVTTDKIQTVFLSDTQTVTEILVQPGDPVKKGDLLMTFDTTLSDLQLERKRLDVEKLKLQLEDAKRELRQINSMKPMKEPSVPAPPTDAELGMELTNPYLISAQKSYDGSTPEKALICWIRSDTDIDDALLAAIHAKAVQYQTANQPVIPPATQPAPTQPAPTQPAPTQPAPTQPAPTQPAPTQPAPTQPAPTQPAPTQPAPTQPAPTQPAPTQPAPTQPAPTQPAPTQPAPTQPAPTQPAPTQPAPTQPDPTQTAATQPAATEPAATQPAETQPSSASAVTPVQVDAFHVVFKVTAGNRALGERQLWQGMKVTVPGGYRFRFESALVTDHMMADLGTNNTESSPPMDMGSGYTASQIAQMRSDQQKKIKDLEFQIKMTDAEYKIMLKEVTDGNIYADSDGKVVSVLTEEEAKQTKQPVLKVSGGGGFYIEGFISELEKENMKPGQEVTVSDWNTGMTYTGNVKSLGDFPTRDGYYNGNGNPNASYYPFRVFVDETADLQAGSYVSIQYSNAESQNGIYLENPFLRTEQGRSYVYVLGVNGKLEQRWVTTGKSLWGNYTEILSGLTAEDLVAFPYGKNVKPGVAAQEGDISDLYN